MITPIENFATSRGIQSLVHFTRLSNLDSILSHGLLPRDKCTDINIHPEINDHYRHDGTDAISATISFPNYKMFYRLRCDNPDIEWVVLKLKSSLLWTTQCAFSDTNAGDSSVYDIPIENRQGLAALQSMFGDYNNIKRTNLNIPKHFTTNPQAEILLLAGASTDDITNVYFQKNTTYQQYKARYPHLSCHLNGGLFDGRSDYAHWK